MKFKRIWIALLLAAPVFGLGNRALAETEIRATCATAGTVARKLIESERASTVLLFDDVVIVGLSVSDPITATVVCPPRPQIVCMEFTNPAKAVGKTVSMSGRIMQADDAFIVLDPCHSILADPG